MINDLEGEKLSEWSQNRIVIYLLKYAGEQGGSESAVEVLGRLLDELDDYREGRR